MRRIVACFCIFALAACDPVVRPELTDADLQRIMVTSEMSRVPSDADLTLLTTSDPGYCIDLHRPGRTFAGDPVLSTEWGRWKIRFGQWLRIRLNTGEWQAIQAPLQSGPPKNVGAAFKMRLDRAEADAMLDVSSNAAQVTEPDWPEGCEIKIWLQQPVYSGDFAFVESGAIGGGGGRGTIMAMEYQDGHWQLVARRLRWIA